MGNRISKKLLIWLLSTGALWGSHSSRAMDLDWSGQFRADAHWVRNYALDGNDGNLTPDPARAGAGGYYVPGGGESTASFETLFMRLRPKLVVNDNIYVKSEWHVGDPVFGLFGDAYPRSSDQRQFFSTQSRGGVIRAQRFWAEFLTDIGTLQLGRAPLSWGLGLVWNAGDNVWDRYQSTGDVVRMLSKFGAFSVSPAIVKYSSGNNIGGSCVVGTTACDPKVGGGGISDYSLMFKYDNPDEDFEGGVNFIKRIGGPVQDPASGIFGVNGTTEGIKYNVWDLYARKKLGRFTVAGEVPIADGDIGGIPYKTFAAAIETQWSITDSWETYIKAGKAPGQPNVFGAAPTKDDKFRAFYFHPNYQVGLIMFRYQLAAFAGPNTQNNAAVPDRALLSPFDNPITNAFYGTVGGGFRLDKWKFRSSLLYAYANTSADPGTTFFNSRDRKFIANTSGKTQAKSLGLEWDLGTTFQWDDSFHVNLDAGFYFPGEFYKFSNSATDNSTDWVFAGIAGVGLNF